MKTIFFIVCVTITAIFCSCKSAAENEGSKKSFGEIAWEKSDIPLRPGVPGKAPFWNAFSQRFIYAPAFNYQEVKNASKYCYEILSLDDSSQYSFESDVPYAPLSPVWEKMPVSTFIIQVVGVSAHGDSLGLAGQGKYYRASPYDPDGVIYHKPVIPYDSSALIALNSIMYKDYVSYWLDHKAPDPGYWIYKYPAKVFGALTVGAVMHARLKPGTESAERSIEMAQIVADYLISISFPEDAPLAFFPPSYYGERIGKNKKSHMQLSNYMLIAAAESGHAYLDLYDYTGKEKYLDAAKRIARTYLATQLDNGTWYLYVNNQTGEPTAENLTIPTAIINYFDRLSNDYSMKGLEKATEDAFRWTMNNPVKTFNWQAQYEDVRAYAPYERLSREQVCDLAIYLFKNKSNTPEYMELAEELIRFAEDQFLGWEQLDDFVVFRSETLRPPPSNVEAGDDWYTKNGHLRRRGKPSPGKASVSPGWFSRNWITPTVHEQYGFWMPSARNTGLMIETYWYAYKVTKKEIYLAKALSIANNFTRIQQYHDGDYPTMFTKYPMNFWINNSIYPAKVMMTLAKDLKALSANDNEGFFETYAQVEDMLRE